MRCGPPGRPGCSTSAADRASWCRRCSRIPRSPRCVGVDVSMRALAIAARRLQLDRMSERQAARVQPGPGLAHLHRQAAQGLRRRRAERGHRAPRPAAAAGAGVRGVRRRATRDGRGDHTERRVQRALGDACRPATCGTATTASSGTARSSGPGPWRSPDGTATTSRSPRSATDDPEVGPPTQMAVFSLAPAPSDPTPTDPATAAAVPAPADPRTPTDPQTTKEAAA